MVALSCCEDLPALASAAEAPSAFVHQLGGLAIQEVEAVGLFDADRSDPGPAHGAVGCGVERRADQSQRVKDGESEVDPDLVRGVVAVVLVGEAALCAVGAGESLTLALVDGALLPLVRGGPAAAW